MRAKNFTPLLLFLHNILRELNYFVQKLHPSLQSFGVASSNRMKNNGLILFSRAVCFRVGLRVWMYKVASIRRCILQLWFTFHGIWLQMEFWVVSEELVGPFKFKRRTWFVLNTIRHVCYWTLLPVCNILFLFHHFGCHEWFLRCKRQKLHNFSKWACCVPLSTLKIHTAWTEAWTYWHPSHEYFKKNLPLLVRTKHCIIRNVNPHTCDGCICAGSEDATPFHPVFHPCSRFLFNRVAAHFLRAVSPDCHRIGNEVQNNR